MHGTRAANYAMDEADLICAVGARFDDRITASSRSSRRARSSSTSTSTRRRSPRTCRRTSRSSATPSTCSPSCSSSTARSAPTRRAWRRGGRRIDGWQEKYPLGYEDIADNEIKPQYMVQALYEATGGEAIVDQRRRPAPDVDGAVLRLPRAAALDQLGRPWHDGLRPARRDGRGGRLPRGARLLHRRRRLGADERPGARDLRPERDPDQGVHHEQRLSGHGPPVAGAVLGRADTATWTWASSPTSSSSPRPTA